MKKLLLCLFVAIATASCGTDNWEYKIVTVNAEDANKNSAREVKVSSDDLNLFGQEGWELVGIYTLTETVHPNFGDNKYVTGLQPNVRTSGVDFVFKRKL